MLANVNLGVTRDAPIRILLFAGLLLVGTCESGYALEVIIPDGQFFNNLVVVFLKGDAEEIERNGEFGLSLHDDSMLGEATAHKWVPANRVSKEQDLSRVWHRTPSADMESRVGGTGLVLLFDLLKHRRDLVGVLWPRAEVRPLIGFREKPSDDWEVCLIGRRLYLANGPGVLLWTSIVLIAVLGSILCLSRWKGRRWFGLLYSGQHLSLAKAQIALWTLAIGGAVFGLGLVHLDVPDVPNSLVVLMGLSLSTGGVRYYALGKARQLPAAGTGDGDNEQTSPSIGDLICVGQGTDRTLSLPKAQMLAWTLIVGGLFVFKSIVEGSLWNVPIEMVALMGVSQIAYVAPSLPGALGDSAIQGSDSNKDPRGET